MENIKELIDQLLTRFETMAKTKSVVGDPIVVQGKTIIPFIEINIGLGAGGGSGEGDEKGAKGKGTGSGGGGGINVKPTAVLIIDENDVKIFPINGKGGFMDKIAEIMPQVCKNIQDGKENK